MRVRLILLPFGFGQSGKCGRGGWGDGEGKRYLNFLKVLFLLRVSFRCSLLPFTGFAAWSAIELSSLRARGLIHYYLISQTKR